MVTLNRPDKRNAISYELIDELLRVLAEVNQSDASILILTGSGQGVLLRHGPRQSAGHHLAQ